MKQNRITINKSRLALAFAAALGLLMAATGGAAALTLKKGEVLASDGTIHFGASPKNKERIIANANRRDSAAGMHGSNVFVVLGDSVTFIPRNELRGKTKESMTNLVGDRVIQQVTGDDDASYADLKAVTEIAVETGVPVTELVDTDSLANLDPAVLEKVETLRSEASLSPQNLESIGQMMDKMSPERLAQFSEDIDQAMAEGMMDKVNDFMNAIDKIENARDYLTRFTSLDDCLANGDAATCREIQAKLNKEGL